MAAALMLGVTTSACASAIQPDIKKSVFSWYEDYQSSENVTAIVQMCTQYSIDTVYQYASRKELSEDSFVNYAKALKEKKIDTVLIYDEPEYSIADFTDFVSSVHTSRASEYLCGVIVDVEPYAKLKQHDPSVLQKYVTAMKAYSKAAAQQNLKFMVCIPTWYDTVSEDLCRELIENADRTVLMNYTKESNVEPISFEVKTAQATNKEIEDAVELQPVDAAQGITSSITYDGSEIEEVTEVFQQLGEQYTGLRGCYHHLHPLYQMIYGKELKGK